MPSSFISVVVPIFNEEAAIKLFHASLVAALEQIPDITYEIIYCNDGSTDTTADLIQKLQKSHPRIRLVSFSRNFGKEYALTAGIRQAKGDAVLMMDGDGQHPVSLIGDFITAWRSGSQVVIGLRNKSENRSATNRLASKLFYALFNMQAGQKLVPGSTDFRLIDREVQNAFLQLEESERITRGLIDWLGFKRSYIHFDAYKREHGDASYTTRQLIRLAVNSFVSLSPIPLYFFGYAGVCIAGMSGLLGITVLIEQVAMRDPLGWRFTGTAMLGILILFLVGIILMSQGILSLYVSRIHTQAKRRPLYIIDKSRSHDIDERL
jgi:dolichol-phosphate mannosyltransferase